MENMNYCMRPSEKQAETREKEPGVSEEEPEDLSEDDSEYVASESDVDDDDDDDDTRHVIYFGAYVEDVSRLVLDCWNDEWNVLSIVLCVMRRLRMSFTYSLAMKVVILLVEWLCYSGAFGKIVMISFAMIMYRCHVKLEDMLLMLGMIGTQYIGYRVIMTSMGLCFRDNSGHFMAGMTQWQQTVISSVEGEAWALLLAMEEARHRGLNRVQFESDSKILIEAIHMKRRGNSEFLSIVHDILSLMSSFINFEVKFVRRQANLVAHTLARAANSWASFHRRRAAWDLLRALGDMSSIPWCIIGDFNDVLSQADKKDIPIEGHPFTWIKSRGTPHVIEERLDRAMASTSWLQLFPQINHSFRFENNWLKEPDLEDVVIEGNQDEEGSMQYQELSERHVTLLIQEEGYWKQRAKMYWLQEGDMNTRFFHMSATMRSKKKKVTKLIADNGTEAHTQEEICEVAKSYFDTLFKPRDGDHDPMHPDKSPGPDGFNPAFYQRFWEQCSDDIFSAASTWLERGYFPTSLNETNICLIPKCGNPTSMKDLRPISLCNVLYKMISKVLANRLKCCLDKCVSKEQSAFVEGRSILDNALIATEVIHALKWKTQGRRGELALKIYISKAYDKVDWGFLRGVMTKMGFSDVWIRWVMMCVSSVNYSVLMNSDRVGPISPGRGLRQGDPLSPYLFILVTECLTALIHQVVGRGDLHGVRICRGAPEVSHLLFADDCFLFCRANVAEVNELTRILQTYETTSGHEVNLLKSEVFISRNMSQAAKEDLSRILGVKLVLGTGIYLGLPSMVGRSKKAIFSYIKDRIWKRINSWRGRALSKAGKEIMIKSVLQAIPSYVMNMFILPASLIDDIEKNDKCFLVEGWWRIGSGDNIRVMHDPWLRGSANRWVPSPQPAGVYQLSVRDLLHENYKAWNIAKVRNLFSKDVAEKILETPLVSSVCEDKVVWEEERNGCYSVKSGYKLAMRYIIGCLPTCSRLLERRVECTLNCPVCDEEIEDELHIFFRCAVARDSWSAAGLSSVLHNATYQQTNDMDRIFAVCSNESSDTVGRMPRQIGRHAFDAWNDWYSVHKLQSNNVSGTTEAVLVRWEKPALDWVKCNVDVAFVSGFGRTSVGLCFRDNSGHFMAGMTQ
ncbi:hypothetical protein TSUD_286030 [Trifolium subterraneum]|uniref:Reverse transcriptase domain-containing protein n=1 Tax=Trifolium subterraneum TaxID=3900 RepID=A0A2Z6NWW2_TRISU|nr:hypothetical protein TSUD_286030 [Trifolium subterraneum]